MLQNSSEILASVAFWECLTSMLQNIKNLKGDTLEKKNPKKSHNAKKIEKGTLQSRPVLYVTLKKGTTFIFQFFGPNGPI